MSDSANRKYCPDCARDLLLSDFSKNARARDGLSFYCTACYRTRYLASKRKRDGPPKTRSGQGPKNVPVDSKWCPQCEGIFALAEFPRNRYQPNGRGAYCKRCHSINSRVGHLKRKYNMTMEQHDAMFARQAGLCAICLEAPAAHIDHDHATGRVRGMLCFNCNGALGQFRDRADLMARAQVYLRAGADAVAQLAPFEFDVSSGTHESQRPDGEDNSYLFEFFDEVEPV